MEEMNDIQKELNTLKEGFNTKSDLLRKFHRIEELHKSLANTITKIAPDITLQEVFSDLNKEHELNCVTEFRQLLLLKKKIINDIRDSVTYNIKWTKALGENHPTLKYRQAHTYLNQSGEYIKSLPELELPKKH